ncbi:MAG: hypothetical protein WAK89_07100 [Candidatus Sulfotelmatobacter sp.]
MPPGTYKQDLVITANSPCTLLGLGPLGGVHIVKSVGTTSSFPSNNGSFVITSSQFTLKNIEYDGNNGSFSGPCITVTSPSATPPQISDIVIEDNYIHNCDGQSITLTSGLSYTYSGPLRTHIRRNRIVGGASEQPILIQGSVNDIDIIDNFIDGTNCTSCGSTLGTINAEAQGVGAISCPANGLSTGACITNLRIKHNKIYCTTAWCIQAGSFGGNQMTGLQIEDNDLELFQSTTQGFVSVVAAGAQITGNTMNNHYTDLGYNHTFFAIENAESTGTVITNNICYCENSGAGGFLTIDGGKDVIATGNHVYGFGEASGIGITMDNSTLVPATIATIAETGYVVTVTMSGTFPTQIQPGVAVAICTNATITAMACQSSAGTAYGPTTVINQNYSRSSKTFSYLSPTTGLSCSSLCGGVALATVYNRVSQNTIQMPLGNALTASIYALQYRNVTDASYIYGNTFQGNTVSGSTNASGETCLAQGSTIAVIDNNSFEENTCVDVANGFNRNTTGTNTRLIKNLFINVGTVLTGSTMPAKNEFIDWAAPTVGATITGCGTITVTGNGFAGSFAAGQTACAPVISPGVTATNGYKCSVIDQSNTGNAFVQSGSNSTSCTFTSVTVTSGDTLLYSVQPY